MAVTTSGPPLDERDARALTECMVVSEVGPGVYEVVGQHAGGEYYVEPEYPSCTCADFRYRAGDCKHIRRVRFATGARPIPAWVDRGRVDDQLGQHVDGEPTFAEGSDA